MNFRNILVSLIGFCAITHSYADDYNLARILTKTVDTPKFSYHLRKNTNDDWIKTNPAEAQPSFSLSPKQYNAFRDEIEIAWKFSDFFKVNFNVFEDNSYSQYYSNPTQIINTRSFGKMAARSVPTVEINRRLRGYKIGLSSDFGIGNNFKLGINLDYGTLNGANLVGFTSENINTSSFALGLRKANFGASVITDAIIENNNFLADQSRMGIEFDWYLSDDSVFSVGTKTHINKETSNTTSSLESLTGNVQYIKFKLNL